MHDRLYRRILKSQDTGIRHEQQHDDETDPELDGLVQALDDGDNSLDRCGPVPPRGRSTRSRGTLRLQASRGCRSAHVRQRLTDEPANLSLLARLDLYDIVEQSVERNGEQQARITEARILNRCLLDPAGYTLGHQIPEIRRRRPGLDHDEQPWMIAFRPNHARSFGFPRAAPHRKVLALDWINRLVRPLYRGRPRLQLRNLGITVGLRRQVILSLRSNSPRSSSAGPHGAAQGSFRSASKKPRHRAGGRSSLPPVTR